WALCWFPLIGGVIGGGLLLWFWLTATLHFGPLFRGIGALLLPIALSGAIHLDGFCDTADALGSHQTVERKLEILQDSHTGAFAI
ncbi:MAG: adenosylcobinamide-GDP ribazoletransferase, partial [Oscillospiraceae bacterium]